MHLPTMENRFTQNERISQAVKSYLQRRNYPASIQQRDINETQMVLNTAVQCETGRNNSIAFSSFGSDPAILEHTFSKFLLWVNDLTQKNEQHNDLYKLVPPLFCHFFIELHQKAHKNRDSMELLQISALSFFLMHLPNVEKVNTDDTITNLLTILQGHSDVTNVKEAFRSNKYCVNLCGKSVQALKKYLAENSHVILLQIIQTWFTIQDGEPDSDENESETTHDAENEMALLKDFMALISTTPPPVYAVHLSNVKDDVTAGCVDRQSGVCTYSYNNMIHVSSLETLKQLPGTDSLGDVTIYAHSARIYDMKHFGNFLLTASHDRTIKLFNLVDYELVTNYRSNEYPAYCLSPGAKGTLFASGSCDNACRLWCYESKHPLRLYAGHTQEVTSVQFHGNGKYFVSGSCDRTVRMWSIGDSCAVRMFVGSAGAIFACAFSDDGKMLATAGDDRSVRVWDLAKGQQICEIKTHGAQTDARDCLINRLLWCANDAILCSGTSSGLVQFWDVKDVWQRSDSHPLMSSQAMNKKLLDLVLFSDTVSCLTAESSASTTFTPS